MKKVFLRLILAALLLACASAPAVADGTPSPMPACWPSPCSATK